LAKFVLAGCENGVSVVTDGGFVDVETSGNLIELVETEEGGEGENKEEGSEGDDSLGEFSHRGGFGLYLRGEQGR